MPGLKEAKIIDAFPVDIPPSDIPPDEAEQPKKRKQSTGTRQTRKKKDKYQLLEEKLQKIIGLPAAIMLLQEMQINAVRAMNQEEPYHNPLFDDAKLIADHCETLSKRLVDIGRQYSWFFDILETLTKITSVGTNPVVALLVEVVVIAVGIAKNHGRNINIPGLSLFTAA